MNFATSYKPIKLNTDKAAHALLPDEAFYLLNHEINNPNALGKATGLNGNFLACDLQLPGGENYVIGKHASTLTNESYAWHYNSNNVHFISKIDENGECQIVYSGDCLTLNPAPRHSIEDWRSYMKIEKICRNRDGKILIWVDGDGAIGSIDVEASIATNFFTTPFFDLCGDPCAYIQLCVPQPCGCLSAEFVPLPVGDERLTNNLLDKGFKFMFKHVYYDGRESEWSDRSSLYYQDARKCFFNGIGASRCLKFRLPIGNPMVEFIKVAFSDDGGVNWYEYETVEKYKKYNSSQDKWYDRQLSENVASSFSSSDCTFEYLFCNDKEKKAISPTQVSRVRNPYPRNPQGLLPIKDSLGYYNYEEGNCPLDKIESEKVDININCPTTGCDIEYATITVRAVIHTMNGNNTFIYRLGDEGTEGDNPDEIAYFGGNPAYNTTPADNLITFDQEFSGKTRNFIVYIEGTDYWTEMKQWKADPLFKNPMEWGVVKDMESDDTKNKWALFIAGGNGASGGGFFYQEGKLTVPKGTRGFLRLVSHEQNDGALSSQNTSATVLGITDINIYQGFVNIRAQSDLRTTELFFDTCDGDTDLDGLAFVINSVSHTSRTAFSGYIKDADGLPVEGAMIVVPNVGVPFSAQKTDWNGFYYFTSALQSPNPATVNVEVETDCGASFNSIQTFEIFSPTPIAAYIRHDEQITSTSYSDNFYTNVKMRVEDCNGTRASGLVVAISGSKARVTDGSGVVTFKIRNYETRNRDVRLVVMDNNGCFTQDCVGGCNPCMPTQTGTTLTCYITNPTLDITTSIVNIDSAYTRQGLKLGGRYPFAYIIEGDCGRLSSAYEIKYLDIPKAQDLNRLSFCDLSYDATGFIAPDWGKCFKILRGTNINPYELQWVVDKIERDPNGRLLLTIQGLNDYNESFFFKTNTIYQWLEGDRVEFIRNGDGSIFKSVEFGILNYQTVSPFRDTSIGNLTTTDADYFNQLIIIDDGRLNDLTKGAIIEMQRPLKGVTETTYGEICVSTPIVNGRLVNETGTFTTFDTYLVTRKIENFFGIFEHHSPSDFWGTRLNDLGKVHFINKYENERRFGRNITISGALQFNYFGDLVKTFDATEQGDIVAMNIVDDNIILAIGEKDNFLAQRANDLLKLDNNNLVRAVPADAIISDPQAKPIGSYGCGYDHIGSIFFGDGFATWSDVNKYAYVRHDYNVARDVSELRVKKYTQRRFQEIINHNKTTPNDLDKLRFTTGQNSQTKAVHLTIKRLRDSGINNEKAPFLISNDTIMYQPLYDEWLGFCSATPEVYSQLNLNNDTGATMITYQNSLPYVHMVIANAWNEFFGVQVDWMIGVALNADRKVVIPLAIEVQSSTMFFVSEVLTDKINFRSEIPPIKFKFNNSKWNAALLNDINSVGGLYNGSNARGFYAKILFIRDNTINNQYGSINNNKRIQYSELDEIILKSMVVEQSGFQVNL